MILYVKISSVNSADELKKTNNESRRNCGAFFLFFGLVGLRGIDNILCLFPVITSFLLNLDGEREGGKDL